MKNVLCQGYGDLLLKSISRPERLLRLLKRSLLLRSKQILWQRTDWTQKTSSQACGTMWSRAPQCPQVTALLYAVFGYFFRARHSHFVLTTPFPWVGEGKGTSGLAHTPDCSFPLTLVSIETKAGAIVPPCGPCCLQIFPSLVFCKLFWLLV